jgi:hypothetical protein
MAGHSCVLLEAIALPINHTGPNLVSSPHTYLCPLKNNSQEDSKGSLAYERKNVFVQRENGN